MKIEQTTSDEAIVDLVRNENKELYVYIVKRYEQKLLNYVQFLIHDSHKAKDVVQQTFIKAYINLNGFNSKKKFSSWLYRIAHNEAMNIVKKYRKEIPLIEDYRNDEDTEEIFSKKEVQQHTHDCLDKMQIKYAEPLILYYFDDKSYDEISDILKLPMGTVATRLNRAKEMMKKLCR